MSKSRRPYLIRAIHEWAGDNGFTPHMVVAADYPGTQLPREYVKDDRITLNIDMQAVRGLDLQSDPIHFSARFSGQPFDVFVPSGAVLAVYAQETGEGVMFGEVEGAELSEEDSPPDAPEPGPAGGSERRSHLRVVK